jgi:hypothetical protein
VPCPTSDTHAKIAEKSGNSLSFQTEFLKTFTAQGVRAGKSKKMLEAVGYHSDYTERVFIDALTKTLESSPERMNSRKMFVELGEESLYIARDRESKHFILMTGTETRLYKDDNAAAFFVEIANILGVDSEDFNSKK